MTFVNSGLILYPSLDLIRKFGVGGATYTLDAVDEAVGMMFQIPADGTCIGVNFATSTVTIGDTLTVSLQTVDTAGKPSGTLYHANATNTIVLADTDDFKVLHVTWTGFTVTKGDIVALVIKASAGGSPNLSIKVNNPHDQTSGFPSTGFFTAAAWTVGSDSLAPDCGLEYTGGVYNEQLMSYAFLTSGGVNLNTGSSPDEVGNLFNIPFGVRVSGFWLNVGHDADFDLVLYDSGDSVLETFSVDISQMHPATNENSMQVFFAGQHEIAKDTDFRLVVKPTSVTNVTVQGWDIREPDMIGALPGGSRVQKTSRTDAGSWTDSAVNRMAVGAILDGIDVPAGGGGAGPGWMI